MNTSGTTSGMDDGVPGVHPGHTPYMNLDDRGSTMVMGRPSALYENSYPGDVKNTWPIGECYSPSRWVWAHNEFTPRRARKPGHYFEAEFHELLGNRARNGEL